MINLIYYILMKILFFKFFRAVEYEFGINKCFMSGKLFSEGESENLIKTFSNGAYFGPLNNQCGKKLPANSFYYVNTQINNNTKTIYFFYYFSYT